MSTILKYIDFAKDLRSFNSSSACSASVHYPELLTSPCSRRTTDGRGNKQISISPSNANAHELEQEAGQNAILREICESQETIQKLSSQELMHRKSAQCRKGHFNSIFDKSRDIDRSESEEIFVDSSYYTDECQSDGLRVDERIREYKKKPSIKGIVREPPRSPAMGKTNGKNNNGFVTRSKRGDGNKIVNYTEYSNEATDIDNVVQVDAAVQGKSEETDTFTIEQVLQTRIGKKGAVGNDTIVYNVFENDDPNKGFNEKLRSSEKHYLIKWKDWSHFHNTWESEASLKKKMPNGMDILHQYNRNEEKKRKWKETASKEELYYYECQRAMDDERIIQNNQADRIVAEKREGANKSKDFLVKWKGLQYSDCSWEDRDLIQQMFGTKVSHFQARKISKKIPDKNGKPLKNPPQVTPFNQPDYLGNATKNSLRLRDYQLDGLNWLYSSWSQSNSCILADEMGLGKTILTVTFLSTLFQKHAIYGPFLIVVPLTSVDAWQREFDKWAPDINVVVYMGDKDSRNNIEQHECTHSEKKNKLKFNCLITTYGIVIEDKQFFSSISWSVLGVDEAHRLKNDYSDLYDTLTGYRIDHRILITGTPLQNSLKGLWWLLKFIMPDKFNDWRKFTDHLSADSTPGYSIVYKELEPYLLRRAKKDVDKSLPAKIEHILRVEMSAMQKKCYKLILVDNYKALRKGIKGSTNNLSDIVMALKKCCNHPNIAKPPTEEAMSNMVEPLVKGSGKLILLDKLLPHLRGSGHRVLIFSQMVPMLDILDDYLTLRQFPFQRLDGSMTRESRRQAVDHFNAEGSKDFCFLLLTQAGGLDINLATADTVILFDSDWSTQNDLQAQVRAHRIGQKKLVSVYRLVTKDSVEESILVRANKNMVLDSLIIQLMLTKGCTDLRGIERDLSDFTSEFSNSLDKNELNEILKFSAGKIFKGSKEEENVQLDDILTIADTHSTEEKSLQALSHLISQYRVVNMENIENEVIEFVNHDWDEIMPEEERQQIEEEEQQIEEEEQQKIQLEMDLPPKKRKSSNDRFVETKTKYNMPLDTFALCKESLRPVKKTLFKLYEGDTRPLDKQTMIEWYKNLVKIGKYIRKVLSEYTKTETISCIKQVKSNLWIFASEFTNLDLHYINDEYKKAKKKRHCRN